MNELHLAARRGEVDRVRKLLKYGKYDVNCVDENGWTPLHEACYEGHVSVVRELIARNADRNAKSKKLEGLGYTPIQIAARKGYEELTLLLLTEFNCNTQTKEYRDRSLLHFACKNGNINLVRTLILKYGADTTARDCSKETPLFTAALNGKDEVASCLMEEFHCDISVKNYQGRSLLHAACESGNINLVCTLILKHGGDITARDKQNNTPLHVAVWWGRNEVTHLLINEFNASLLDTDSDGNTPLHVCSARGHTNCVEVMLAANAPVLIRNKAGKTPRDLAGSKVKSLLNDYMSKNRGKIYQEYDVLQKNAKKKYSTAERITRIFVIGNPGAGKSTLVENLKREGYFNFRRVSEFSVPLHTAGIVPSVHTSKHYGRVLFYDFAGDAEYFSSHAAILENFFSASKGDNIFIIVVDLREDKNDYLKNLNYWLAFVQHQKFWGKSPHVLIAGSHSDKVLKEHTEAMSQELMKISEDNNPTTVTGFFALDCGKPKSNEIQKLQQKIASITIDSPRYQLSLEASILLGLLEKDFRDVTTCTVENIVSHIEETHMHLPTNAKLLCTYLNELHEVGLIFNLKSQRGNESRNIIMLNTSELTNEVHKRLFSDEAQTVLRDAIGAQNKVGRGFNIGIIPESVLHQILPESIPTECLVQLQYCQEINTRDVADIPDFLPSSSTSDHTFLFFPALCTADKSDVSWTTHDDRHYSIGWLARCTDPRHFFPPRFLHVLLLRLVFRFTLSAPTHSQATTDSPHHSYFQRRCTMWKTGVHWLMEEGVECMVELVSINQVVVITKSPEECMENCISVFNQVISCVMEAKAEFCHSIKPQFFLLNSTESPDYLSESNLFAMSEVEKILSSGKEAAVSSDGNSFLPRQQILFLRKLTHWDSLFPLDFSLVLQLLKDVVDELFELGLQLNISPSYLRALETNFFSTNFDKARRELVREWLSSSLNPPCWWHLVQALRVVGRGDIANMIERKYDSHVGLEKSLLSGEKQSLKPEEEFLEEFAGVVESKWPALASVLSLTSAEIEQLKKKGEELSQKECALQMLRQWAAKEDATYGQLCQRLKTISLFQW